MQRFLLWEPLSVRASVRLSVREPSCARDSCIRSSASPWSMIVKSFAHASGGPKAAQQPVRRCRGTSPVDPATRAADQPLGPREHFLGGAPRECEQEYPLRPNASVDEVGDPVTRVRVFPVPAPAMIRRGPLPNVAAAACSGLSSAPRSFPGGPTAVSDSARAPTFVNTRFRHAPEYMR